MGFSEVVIIFLLFSSWGFAPACRVKTGIISIRNETLPFFYNFSWFLTSNFLLFFHSILLLVKKDNLAPVIYGETQRLMMNPVERPIDLVMLVDDNDTDNFISKRIIEITKFAKRVEVKNSGKSALDYLAENENNPENLPNIIFLDINMPVVDGFVFLYEFEKFTELVRTRCKVIILSSSDNKRDIDKIVNNNYVIKFITKPLTEMTLDEIKLNNIYFHLSQSLLR